jgi:nucleoside-diphosphate-sugar epimerase
MKEKDQDVQAAAAPADGVAGRTLVLIGLGDVGATLAARLVAGGARVIGVRRGADAPEGVELVRGDATDPQTLAALPDAPDAVVICVTPTSYDEAGYRAGYEAVARAVAERWRDAGVRRLLWVSSTAVYGPECGDPVDDATAPKPDNFRGRVLLDAEAALAASGNPLTAVRASGIYGPGRFALIRRVLEGRGAPVPGPGESQGWTNRIHRDDLVGVLAFLLARSFAGEALPDSVLATDPTPTPRHELLGWLAERLGASLDPGDGDAGRTADRRLLPTALPALGYRFRYPDYRAGFEQVLSEAEASGALAELRAPARA